MATDPPNVKFWDSWPQPGDPPKDASDPAWKVTNRLRSVTPEFIKAPERQLRQMGRYCCMQMHRDTYHRIEAFRREWSLMLKSDATSLTFSNTVRLMMDLWEKKKIAFDVDEARVLLSKMPKRGRPKGRSPRKKPATRKAEL